jgi:hypothetical protein
MGVIFKDITDDQQEAMMETTYIGLTWQIRYMRIKYWTYMILATASSVATTATVDYALFKFTDYSGIVGWLLS